MNGVRIYQLSRAFETWVWLCRKCLWARKTAGWEIKESKAPPHPVNCDDCNPPVALEELF